MREPSAAPNTTKSSAGPTAAPLALCGAGADRCAKHHEIERGRYHGRDDALQQGAPGAGHFEFVDCADGVEIHCACTRLTKMSSSDDCDVSRSSMRRPALRRSPSRLVMPVRSPLVS